MQDLLTFAIEAVTVGFGAFMLADFVIRLASRKQPVAVAETAQVEPECFVPNPDGFAVATEAEAALVESFWQPKTVAAVETLCDPWEVEVEPIATVAPLFTQPPTLLLLPAAKVQNWAALTPEQLRKECSAKNIKWRSVHGKNKHLKKAEMVALLSA